MAADSILPFNTVTINAAATTTATFVWGSGTVRATPVLVQNTAGDGTLSKACAAKDIEASWDMIGDQTALNTTAPDQDQIIINAQTFYGTVSAQYSEESNRTSMTARGKTTADALGDAVGIESTTGGALL